MGEGGINKDKEFLGMTLDAYVALLAEKRSDRTDFPSWEEQNCYRCGGKLTAADGTRVPDFGKGKRIIGMFYAHSGACPKKDYRG
jgi:hypothetical protein